MYLHQSYPLVVPEGAKDNSAPNYCGLTTYSLHITNRIRFESDLKIRFENTLLQRKQKILGAYNILILLIL